MTFNEAKEFYGKQIKIGQVLNLSKSSISLYKDRGGIPFDHQCVIEESTNGKLKAKREDDPQNVFYIPPSQKAA